MRLVLQNLWILPAELLAWNMLGNPKGQVCHRNLKRCVALTAREEKMHYTYLQSRVEGQDDGAKVDCCKGQSRT